MDWGNHPLFRTFQMGELSRFLRFGMLFPTSLRGVLVFDSVSRRRLPPPPPPPPVFSLTKNFVTHHLSHTTLSTTTLSHTIFHRQLCHTPSFTHNFFFVTHHLSQTTLPHTIFHTQLFLSHTIFHRQLCHTPSFTHNFVTHHLSHKSHTQLCQPQLFHTPSFTHNFVTHNFVTHHLSHITLSHKTLSITTFSPHLCTWRHPLSLCVAGVALMALGWLWWRAWARLVARGAAPLCVAGVALGDIHLRFAWQAWHLATSTFTLHGRRGTYGTGLALVARLGAVSRPRVAGVALGDIRFAWQVWHWVT